MIAAVYAAALSCCLVFVFRYFIFSGFDGMAGDDGDARLTMAQLEHWRGVFAGKTRYDSPIWFYPIRHILGIQDGYFLSGTTYAAARVLLDEHASLEVGLMLTCAIGFVGMALLLCRGLRLNVWVGLIGAVLFTIAGNLYRVHVSQQFLVICYVPLIAWLVIEGLTGAPSRARAVALPAASFLFVALWWSTFYIAWYASIFLIFLSMLALAGGIYRVGIRQCGGAVLSFLRSRSAELAGCAAIVLTGGTMFISLYLPWLRAHGGWPYEVVHSRLLRPMDDLVVAGPDNWVWGYPFNQDADAFGFPPVFAALCLFGIVSGTMRLLRRGVPVDWSALYCFGAGIAALLLWVCFVRIGDWTLYWLIYTYVPGGSAMRVPVRVNFFLVAVFTPIVMVAIRRFWDHARMQGLVAKIALAALVVVALAEEGTSRQLSAWSRARDRDLLAAIPAPPANCTSFFVNWTLARPWDNALLQYFYSPMSDAMLLSARWNVPTLNGLGTAAADSWPAPPPMGEKYENAIRMWVTMHKLNGVCRVILPLGAWGAYSIQ